MTKINDYQEFVKGKAIRAMKGPKRLRVADLEAGGIYESQHHQRREIVLIVGQYLLWRMVDLGDRAKGFSHPIGFETWCPRHRFTDWAVREVA